VRREKNLIPCLKNRKKKFEQRECLILLLPDSAPASPSLARRVVCCSFFQCRTSSESRKSISRSKGKGGSQIAAPSSSIRQRTSSSSRSLLLQPSLLVLVAASHRLADTGFAHTQTLAYGYRVKAAAAVRESSIFTF
jgi:hypothetical protein